MFLKKLAYCCSALALTLSPTLQAETDPDFTDGILTMPRVVVGDQIFEEVKLQLNFDDQKFSLVSTKPEPKSRFKSQTNGIDEVLIDNVNNLTWINGSHACKINADAAETASEDAAVHCASLDFAGYTDWRAPTSAEMADMIVNADRLNITLNYRNPNCQFMATTDGFVQTENNKEPGKVVESAVNSGTRCVLDK